MTIFTHFRARPIMMHVVGGCYARQMDVHGRVIVYAFAPPSQAATVLLNLPTALQYMIIVYMMVITAVIASRTELLPEYSTSTTTMEQAQERAQYKLRKTVIYSGLITVDASASVVAPAPMDGVVRQLNSLQPRQI